MQSTALVGGATVLSRILGFVRDLLIARQFGADALTDAFFVAFKIPNFLRRLFAEGAFSQAFVPVLTESKASGLDETRDFLGKLAGVFMLVLGLVTVLGVFLAPVLVGLFAPGLWGQGEIFDLATTLLRITFPYLFFISLTAFAGGILNTFGYFALPALTPILLNLSLIAATLWLAPECPVPVMALAIGVLIAGLLQCGVQIPALKRLGLLPKPRLIFDDTGVRRVAKLLLPALFGASVQQVNLLVNTLLASFLVSGSISWLYYSDRLLEFPLGVFGVALGTVILPHLSASQAETSGAIYSATLDWALRWVVLIGLPASLGLGILAYPLMLTLFQSAEFSFRDAEMAGRSLMGYAPGLLGFLAVKVLTPAFSARQDMSTPARIGSHAVLTNLFLSVFFAIMLSPYGWGHAGLALAVSLAAWLNAGSLLWQLVKTGAYCPGSGWWVFLVRVSLANVGMGCLLMYVAYHEPWASGSTAWRALHLGIWIPAGILLYLTGLILTGMRPRHLVLTNSH